MTLPTEQHQSLAELTYRLIRNKIISGEFQAGDWLRQEQLAQEFKVSHTPIREALDRLVAYGLAERIVHRGVRISEINKNEIEEFFFLRLLLDPVVARLAAKNITNKQLLSLKLILQKTERMTLLNDMPTRRSSNREFHRIISVSTGNKTLERLYETLWNRFPDWIFYEGLYKDPDTIVQRFNNENEDHKKIYEALASHDLSLAVKLTTDHIKYDMRNDLIEVFHISDNILDEFIESLQ
jgi:DNA-binding GntR family transcriptional regulator